MKRYIVHSDGMKLLNRDFQDAHEVLSSDKVIDQSDNLKWSHLDLIYVELSFDEASMLRANGLFVQEEQISKAVPLSVPYENYETMRIKIQKGNYTGRGVKIAVMDKGFPTSTDVPMVARLNYSTDGTANPTDHGSFTSSQIKSQRIGWAPGCQLTGIKIIADDDTLSDSAFISGLNYCLANGIDAINASFQTYSSPSLFQSIIDSLWAAGSIIFAASGNGGYTTNIAFPASGNHVVAVGGSKVGGLLSDVTSAAPVSGKGITIVAPCEYVTGVATDDTIYTSNGTSFACTMVAGAFACYKEMLGVTDNKLVLQKLLNNAIRNADPKWGYGLLNC